MDCLGWVYIGSQHLESLTNDPMPADFDLPRGRSLERVSLPNECLFGSNGGFGWVTKKEPGSHFGGLIHVRSSAPDSTPS